MRDKASYTADITFELYTTMLAYKKAAETPVIKAVTITVLKS